ncbi:MAG: isoprenylcysteine carboxylmethyltransferase family protein [Candidatus Acidiferrales bacterium]
MSEPRKFWMRWRVRVGYPVAAVFWLLANPLPVSILIGGIVAAFGLAIRAAASGHLRKDRELATSGPYARTRNPLYLGSAFLAAGFAIAGRSWPAGVLVVGYFAIFYYAVMRNEAEDLHRRFGAAFDAYAARVPFFFPRFARAYSTSSLPAGEAAEKFSWAQYRRNREYRALIGTIAGLGIVWLRMWFRGRFGY